MFQIQKNQNNNNLKNASVLNLHNSYKMQNLIVWTGVKKKVKVHTVSSKRGGGEKGCVYLTFFILPTQIEQPGILTLDS